MPKDKLKPVVKLIQSASAVPAAHLIRLSAKTTLDGFTVTVGVDPALCKGIRDGDALVLAEGSSGKPMVVAFARAYHVRFWLDRAVIYFDGILHLSTAKSAADLGIDITDETPAISRLDWHVFEAALKSAAGIEFSGFPLIEGNTAQQQAYLRDLLQLAVTDDLLGPACGPEEEIVDNNVRNRYLVGKLAPQTGGEGEYIEGLYGALARDEGADEDSAPSDLTPLAAPNKSKKEGGRRYLPGEEFATASDATDSESDEAREVDASKNQSFVPSSFGLTVCVDGEADELELEASWGRYYRTTSEEQTLKDGKPLLAWKRVPCGGKLKIALKSGVIDAVAPDPECPQVLIQGSVRPPLPSGDRLVTVFIVNNQLKPEKNQDEAWLFQPELVLRHPAGEPVFRRRQLPGNDDHDDERAALEMMYRRRVEFAAGHGVAVHSNSRPEDPERAYRVCTRVIPEYEVQATEVPGRDPADRPAMRRLVAEGLLDMKRLAGMERPKLLDTLRIMADDYEAWIGEQNLRIGKDVVGFDKPAKLALERCGSVLVRLREGISVLETDDKAFASFRFANRAMADQRLHSVYALRKRRGDAVELADLDKPEIRSWRPFQLAFILLSVPSLADPTHRDRTRPVDATADLLWFPTGGGKTEAYLGVAAFAMAIRRLQGALGGLDASRGLSVIMRYTLRLLTVQQFQRTATLICAMEVIRRSDEATWGATPFTLGLWVGMKVTPNSTEDSHEAILKERTNQRPQGSSPAQLTNCPWCGTKIQPGKDIEVRRHKDDIGRTFIYCGDKLGQCDFSRAKSENTGIPILVVDEEIYRFPPSMLIATVDKFAMMAWRGQVRTLFGRATRECPRHGLLWQDAECKGNHQGRGNIPAVQVKSIAPLRPPDLIIQDELHLITGPLGTMVALYETAVDELSIWQIDGKSIRPKVIASTATVRKADDQINNVFLRKVSVFPPHGIDIEDNFFSIQRPTEQMPGRHYLGFCSPGSARPAVLIRLYTALLTASQELFERFGPAADPWMTIVGYFNSLRELGGMRRNAEDDVHTRAFRVLKGRAARPCLAQRYISIVDELTSRVSNKDIPKKLDQLEVRFEGELVSESGRFKLTRQKNDPMATDIVLASNMLGVGVDVRRLGLMVVNGQPKSTSEYIQATSRIGRFFPGLVCTVLTWSRPRDLSHYETFEHYHATFYKHVEAQSVTPFAPRALDRGLTGAMVSCLRLGHEEYNPNLGAGRLVSVSKPEIGGVRLVVSDRAGRVTGVSDVGKNVEKMAAERCDEWVSEAVRPGRRLGYEAGRRGSTGEDDIAALLNKPGSHPWNHFTVPLSLREVEAGVKLVMDAGGLAQGPAWRSRARESQQSEGAE